MTRAGLFLSLCASIAIMFAVGGCNLKMQVDNPDYKCWKEFPPGSSVTFEGLQRIGDDQPEAVILTVELIDIDDEHAVLRRIMKFPSRKESRVQSQTSVEQAKIDQADHPETHPSTKKDFKGWDTVIIDEKSYPCTTWEYQAKHVSSKVGVDQCGELVVKEWKCNDIPGGTARVEYEAKTPQQYYQIAGEVISFHIEPEQPKIEKAPKQKEKPTPEKTEKIDKSQETPTPAPDEKAQPESPTSQPVEAVEEETEVEAIAEPEAPHTQPVLPKLEDFRLQMETSGPMPEPESRPVDGTPQSQPADKKPEDVSK